MRNRKIIGVLGGMGPAATLELFSRIINNTEAETDQEHVNMIIINDTLVPDRTRYILGEGISPVPRLLNNLNKLRLAGADLAVIPCMTAHSFINELTNESPIPIINALDLVEEFIKNNLPNADKVGLLATTGSITSRIFHNSLSAEIITPDTKGQNELMDVIYGENGIKAGNTSLEVRIEVKRLVNTLKEKGIQAVIAGCTELSLVMFEEELDIPIIDPIMLLALEAVRLGSNNEV